MASVQATLILLHNDPSGVGVLMLAIQRCQIEISKMLSLSGKVKVLDLTGKEK